MMTSLKSKWVLWVHKVNDSDWSLDSYEKICEIDSIENFWLIYNNWDEHLPRLDMGIFFLMREGIFPKWEDARNINGGCWSMRVSRNDICNTWNELTMAMIGEYLCLEDDKNNEINGLSISPKKNFCVIKIWNTQCIDTETDIFSDIPFLDLSGSIYRKWGEALEADREKLKHK
tara:strand:+ start:2254 stop:2775 length:522 start_codon:yes stop_codon:yes gene_type:complete